MKFRGALSGRYLGVPAEWQVSRTMTGGGMRFESRILYRCATVLATPVGSGVDTVERGLHFCKAGGDLVQKCEVDPRRRLFCGVHVTIVVSNRSGGVVSNRSGGVVSNRSGGLRPPQAAARRTNLLRVPQAIEPWKGTPKLKIPPSEATSQ